MFVRLLIVGLNLFVILFYIKIISYFTYFSSLFIKQSLLIRLNILSVLLLKGEQTFKNSDLGGFVY